MKILYSLPHPADTLGSERAGHVVRANALLAELESMGHEVIRVEAADSQAQLSVRAYREVVKRLLPPALALPLRDAGRYLHSRRYASQLLERAEQTRPDVLLETYTPMSVAGVRASAATGVPLVVDDLAPSWEDDEVYGVSLQRLSRRVRRQLLAGAGLVVAVNARLARAFREEGVPAASVVTVGNGISEAFFTAGEQRAATRHTLGLAAGDAVAVFVGSFQPFHRVDLLVDAFAAMPDRAGCRLLLVGDGTALDDARRQVRRLGLEESVTFTGQLAHSQVPAHVAAADVGVLPASAEYTNPMKILEYLAAGLPVVAPRQETVAEVVADGVTGVLFEPSNSRALAGALGSVLLDGELRQRLAVEAGAQVRAQTWAAQAARLVDALEGVSRRSSP